jgi:hypothetical protein
MILHGKKEEEVAWIEVWWVSEVIRDHGGFFFPPKTPCVRARCHGAGSTCRGTILASHEEPLSQTYRSWRENFWLTVWPSSTNVKYIIFLAVKETNRNFIVFWFWLTSALSLGVAGDFYCMLCRFISRLYWRTQLSSPVMTLQSFVIPFDSLQNISVNLPRLLPWGVSAVLWHHIHTQVPSVWIVQSGYWYCALLQSFWQWDQYNSLPELSPFQRFRPILVLSESRSTFKLNFFDSIGKPFTPFKETCFWRNLFSMHFILIFQWFRIVFVLSSLSKYFMFIFCLKHASPIFATSYANTPSLKTHRLCTRDTYSYKDKLSTS